MTEELKPVKCGCGGEAVICGVDMSSIDEHDVCYVFCNKCGIETRMYDYDTEAIEAWNTAMSGSAEEKLKAFWDGMSAEMKEESAEPGQKKGRWQRRKGSDCWECSQCHAVLESNDIVRHNFYYCYHCGADMMNEDGYMKLEGTEHE